MIPRRLSVKGLYSYQDHSTATIDFDRLVEGRLFGIFGPVGSGKSALLEAMSFALYGHTERLNQREGRSYNMMNLKSDRLEISFEFEVGGRLYKFEVQARRNSKNFEDTRTFTRSAYQWEVTGEDKGEWKPLETTDASAILGLSYEHFVKTIIIPQGRFQEFLHMSTTDRTRMLQDLFSLGRFDLAGPTKALIKENEHALAALEGQLKELPEVKEEEVQAKENERGEKEKALAEAVEQEGKLKVEQEKWGRIKELRDSLVEVREILGPLLEDEAEFRQQQQELQEYQLLRANFQESLERQGRLRQREEELENALEKLKGEMEKKDQEKAAQEEVLAEAKKAFEGREKWRLQAEELDKVAEVFELEGQMAGLKERMDKGLGKIEEQKNAMVELGKEVEEKEKQERKMTEAQADLPKLLDIQSRLQERGRRATELQAVRDSLEAQQALQQIQLNALSDWLTQANADHGRTIFPTPDPASPDILPQFQAAIDAQRTSVASQSKSLDAARLKSGLAAFAQQVRPGEPCPLCGATDHPSPYHDETQRKQITALQAELQQTEQRLDALLGKQSHLIQQVEVRNQHATKTKELKVAVQQRQAHLEEMTSGAEWEELDLETVQKDIAAAKQQAEQLAKLRKELTEMRDREKVLRAELERFQKAIEDFRHQQTTLQAKANTLREQLDQVDPENLRSKGPADLRAEAKVLRKKLREIETAFDAAGKALESILQHAQQVRTQLEVTQSGITATRKDVSELSQSLNQKLAQSNYEDLADIQRILAKDIDLEGEKARIEGYFKQLNESRAEFEALEKQLDGRTYDDERHQTVLDRLATLAKEQREMNKALGGLSEQIKKMKEDRKKRAELIGNQGELLTRRDNLKLLKGLFDKSGFVNYISTIYLRDLCQRANERFQLLTQNRLSLEIDPDNQFVIRDMLNDGRSRSVKTLSGGQTFQAALSLALALADNIHQRSQHQHNFFFLDEGFGTLDRASLTTVFETLKQLRRENRIVGIISHVEELQEEIDLSIRVSQDEESGSRIKASWE